MTGLSIFHQYPLSLERLGLTAIEADLAKQPCFLPRSPEEYFMYFLLNISLEINSMWIKPRRVQDTAAGKRKCM